MKTACKRMITQQVSEILRIEIEDGDLYPGTKIPTDAEDDWITAVSTVPASTPKTGMENFRRIPVNSGTSARGLTAPLMVSIPNISTENPIRIVPISFFLASFKNIRKTTPIRASTCAKDVGFKS